MKAIFHSHAILLALILSFCAAPPADTAQAGASRADPDQGQNVSEAVYCPAVTLKHWQDSSHEEKSSFLLGFITMVEVEKEWQGTKPLPIGKSLTGAWVRGLSGVTVQEMVKAVDAAVLANPDKPDMQVVEALGHAFIRPKLTDREYKEARERQKQLEQLHSKR